MGVASLLPTSGAVAMRDDQCDSTTAGRRSVCPQTMSCPSGYTPTSISLRCLGRNTRALCCVLADATVDVGGGGTEALSRLRNLSTAILGGVVRGLDASGFLDRLPDRFEELGAQLGGAGVGGDDSSSSLAPGACTWF